MKVSELIDRLRSFDPGMEVSILDGFNGSGEPRAINMGPVIQKITAGNCKECADFEGREGESIAVLGFGCH